MENNELSNYYQIRSEYVKNQYDQCKIYDQSIFVIAVGIFGLSFTFISQIVKNPIQNTKWILLLSWYYICVSIIVSLVAYLINYYAYRYEINRIDLILENNDQSYLNRKNVLSIVSQEINIINLLFLLIGIICLLVYVVKNF
jgi:hypothetical protein